MHYVPGQSMYEMLSDPSIPEATVTAELERFGAEWARRHALAIERREARLLHEHGTFRHIWIGAGRQINFDFEICWTSAPRIVQLAGRETASFLRSLGRATADPTRFEARLKVLAAAYGRPDQVAQITDAVLKPKRALTRIAYFVERWQKRHERFAPRRVLSAFADATKR